MNVNICPWIPMDANLFSLSAWLMLSNTFNMLKNTVMVCFLLRKAYWISVSNITKWSIVDLPF